MLIEAAKVILIKANKDFQDRNLYMVNPNKVSTV